MRIKNSRLKFEVLHFLIGTSVVILSYPFWSQIPKLSLEDAKVFFYSIPPFVGGFYACGWLWQLFRERKFNGSYLDTRNSIISLGSLFEASVFLPNQAVHGLSLDQLDFFVTISNFHNFIELANYGDQRKVRQIVALWQDRRVFKCKKCPGGIQIPISFWIPADANPTDTTIKNNAFRWRLDIRSSLPGFDFAADYYLNMQRTEQTDSNLTRDNLPDTVERSKNLQDENLVEVRVEDSNFGRTLTFPRFCGRKRSIGLIFDGVGFLSVALTAAITGWNDLILAKILSVGFALVGVFLLLRAIFRLFVIRSILLTERGVYLERDFLGIKSRNSFSWLAVADVNVLVYTSWSGFQPSYYVQIIRKSNTDTVTALLSNRSEAEWIRAAILNYKVKEHSSLASSN